MHYITAIHLVGGNGHEHIDQVKWLNGANGKANSCSRAAMIEFIQKPNPVQVGGVDGPAAVAVVAGNPPYLRTHEDGQYNNNLLALPRF
jgi:hypothetical protein